MTRQSHSLTRYSAALCRGLIEAWQSVLKDVRRGIRIPRLYAAASLKRVERGIEVDEVYGIPRLYAAASLKPTGWVSLGLEADGIPRLYAAASLKHHLDLDQR